MSRKQIWFDIDTATREQLATAFAQERARVASLLTQITFDMDYWNSHHPTEEPLKIVLDFWLDIAEERLARTPQKPR